MLNGGKLLDFADCDFHLTDMVLVRFTLSKSENVDLNSKTFSKKKKLNNFKETVETCTQNQSSGFMSVKKKTFHRELSSTTTTLTRRTRTFCVDCSIPSHSTRVTS